MVHHANVDRQKMAWMNAYNATASYYYGYPTVAELVNPSTGAISTSTRTGLSLNDEASMVWGFTDADLLISAHTKNTTLWTHADALCYLQPNTAPYTYDSLSF